MTNKQIEKEFQKTWFVLSTNTFTNETELLQHAIPNFKEANNVFDKYKQSWKLIELKENFDWDSIAEVIKNNKGIKHDK